MYICISYMYIYIYVCVQAKSKAEKCALCLGRCAAPGPHLAIVTAITVYSCHHYHCHRHHHHRHHSQFSSFIMRVASDEENSD